MAHGTPIGPGEDDEPLGVAGQFILDAGISSTYRIARFWGLGPRQAEPRTELPADTAPLTVNSIRRTFNDLATAELNSDDASFLGTFNMVAGQYTLHWVLYNDGVFFTPWQICKRSTTPAYCNAISQSAACFNRAQKAAKRDCNLEDQSMFYEALISHS